MWDSLSVDRCKVSRLKIIRREDSTLCFSLRMPDSPYPKANEADKASQAREEAKRRREREKEEETARRKAADKAAKEAREKKARS